MIEQQLQLNVGFLNHHLAEKSKADDVAFIFYLIAKFGADTGVDMQQYEGQSIPKNYSILI